VRKLAILCAALAFGCAGETGTPTGLASPPAFNVSSNGVTKNATTSSMFEVKLSCSKVAALAYWRPVGATEFRTVPCGATDTYTASAPSDSIDFYFGFFQSTVYGCPTSGYATEALTVRAKCYPDGSMDSHGQALATFTAKHPPH
jgi:hypothetical protein